MVYITVSRDISLLDILNDLLRDLNVSNPEYRIAFDIGQNPVIETISREFDVFNLMCAVITHPHDSFMILSHASATY